MGEPTLLPEQPMGLLAFHQLSGRTVASRVFATSPLKFVLPTTMAPAMVDAVWVYVVRYGGGLQAAGDVVTFKVDVDSNCSVALTTPASPKVRPSRFGKVSLQIMEAHLGPGSLLAVLPDPITPLVGSRLVQKQSFQLDLDASLVLVDWMTSGRKALGESWEFASFETANSVECDGKVVLQDKLELRSEEGVKHKMGGAHVMGMVLLIGPRLEATMRHIAHGQLLGGLDTSRWGPLGSAKNVNESPLSVLASGKCFSDGDCKSQGVLKTTVSTIADGNGLLVRFVASDLEAAYAFLREALAPLGGQLGRSPFAP